MALGEQTNLTSILGGIIRGLTNNTSSAGLNQTNTQSSNNPLTYQWIGNPTPSDLRQPTEKEQTQNPALQFAKGSGGTAIPYSNPPLTDIPTLITQGSPGTDVSNRSTASSVGSPTNIPASYAPLRNTVGNGYGMMPQNGDHFKTYFANQIGLKNILQKPSAAAVALAVAEQQHFGSAGNADAWKQSYNLFSAMQKNYAPGGYGNYRW